MVSTRNSVRLNPEVIMPDSCISGEVISVAPLQTVNLQAIRRKDAREVQKLRDAAQYPGCCYLEIGDSFTGLSGANKIAHAYFAQEVEEKMRDVPMYRRGREEIVASNSAQVYGTTGDKSRVFGMLDSRLSHLQIACDDASDVLLEACYSRAKSKISSSLELVSGSRLATQETENDILGMVFHDKIKPQYTTEIRLTRSGLDYDAQWAHVVPKPGCILLTMRGSQRRSCWSLPGQDERVWIVFNVR